MSDIAAIDLKDLAARRWFGYGRWDAPYWFVGMEPGGTDHPELYTAWEAAGGTPLIDAAIHEAEWNRRVSQHLQMHHFAEKPQIQKSTWQPLIHIMLGFTGAVDDPHFYQRDQLGRAQGDTALIELSSIASKEMSVPGDRDRYLSERISVIKRELRSNPVTFAVFYGTTYRHKYEQIAGGPFDDCGFRWDGNTLCALITHPSRPTKKYSYWRAYGELLRGRVDSGCGAARGAAIGKEQEP